MGKRIVNPADLETKPPTDQGDGNVTESAGDALKGVTFICNHAPCRLKFDDGTHFDVKTSKFTVTDEETIKNLRAIAEKKKLFEVP